MVKSNDGQGAGHQSAILLLKASVPDPRKASIHCETQRFTDQKLSSPIFACRSFVRPASVISPLLHYMMF